MAMVDIGDWFDYWCALCCSRFRRHLTPAVGRPKSRDDKEQVDEAGQAFLALPDQVETIQDIEWEALFTIQSHTHIAC